MLSIHQSHEVSAWMMIYIILILFVVTEATILPVYYWLALNILIVIGMIIICYTKFKSTKHQMLIAMYIILHNMILLGMETYNGIRPLFLHKK